MVEPLCIVQARLKSTRLNNKMLLELGNETLIGRGHRIACQAFGRENVVVAIPFADNDGPLGEELRGIGANVYAHVGDESDVLSRFRACAYVYRWHPDAVIVRWTPDDFRKEPAMCRRVAAGERLPVQQGAEAFTLARIDWAQERVDWKHPDDRARREHLSLLYPYPPLEPPDDGYPWSIDTQADLDGAREWLARFEPNGPEHFLDRCQREFDEAMSSATRAAHDQPGNMQR